MPRRRRRRTSLGAIAFLAIVASAASSGASSPPGKSPPVLRTPPSIAGVAVEGKTLTADPGEWSGRVKKYAFYWARCDAGGGACSPISGARGVTFLLSATDVGKTLRVTVIATNKNGSTVATSAPSGVVASAPAPPPPPPALAPPPPAPPETVLTSVVCGATGTASCRDGNNNGGESILVTYSITNADSAEIQLGAGQPWKPLGASPAGSWVDASCSAITISVRAKRSSDGAVDASPASQALTVTPYGGCASPPPPPPPAPTTDVPPPPTDVLAKSGFEAAVSLAPNDDWNDWQWLSGVDQATGFDWTNKHLWGSPWPWGVLSIVCGSSPCPTGIPSDYVTSTIETVTGYNGQSTRALKLHSKKPNPNLCCQQVGFGNAQLDLSSSLSRDYYMRARWKVNPDMQTQATSLGTAYWRQTWVYKTANRNRIQVDIANHPGYVHWYVQSDDFGASASGVPTIYWAEDTRVGVPTDRWFTIEIAYHRAPDSTGRFFLGVDGRTVVDHRGPTMGSALWEEVNNVAHAEVYTANKLPGYLLVDDLEVRNGPPCATLPCAGPQ